ncbi:hypothetical protein [Streptomyces uncialis]|uniref:hypothetical protein n=1 Tax=Streptomyces uncialis TaxID=1048205 RepID=UPI00386342A6|nr:hypothetical protein OG268_06045 [Streptomyces uncialis]
MSSSALPGARRRGAALAAAAALLLTGVFFTGSAPSAQAAQAVGIDVECLGTFSRTFSPAVTSTPQTVTSSSTYTYNTCAIGSVGTGTTSTALTLSCIPLTAGPAETESVTWLDATGGTSTIVWQQPTVVAQTVVYTGTVTAGRYLGDTATKVTSGVSYVGSVISCLLGTPISSATGLVDSLLLTS